MDESVADSWLGFPSNLLPARRQYSAVAQHRLHREGAARALAAGVAGKRSHGWRSAAGTRVQLWPGRPKQTSGDRVWAAPSPQPALIDCQAKP